MLVEPYEPFEHSLSVGCWDPRAIVLHHDHRGGALPADGDEDLGARVAYCVLHDVSYSATDELCVPQHASGLAFESKLDVGTHSGAGLHGVDGQVIEVHLGAAHAHRRVCPGQGQQVAHQQRRPVHLLAERPS